MDWIDGSPWRCLLRMAIAIVVKWICAVDLPEFVQSNWLAVNVKDVVGWKSWSSTNRHRMGWSHLYSGESLKYELANGLESNGWIVLDIRQWMHPSRSYSQTGDSGSVRSVDIAMAIEQVYSERGKIMKPPLERFLIKDGQCREEIAAGHVIDMMENGEVDVLISSPCPQSAFISAVICTRFNVPLLNWAVTSTEMADPERFQIVARTVGSASKMGHAISELLSYFEWQRVALLITDDGVGRKCHSIGQGTSSYLAKRGIHATFILTVDGEEPRDDDIDRFLTSFEKVARIAIVCLDKGIRRFMLRAQERRMTAEDYIYIIPEYVQNENRTDLWTSHDSVDGRNLEAKVAFNTSLFLEMQLVASDELHQFKKMIPERMRAAPFFYFQQKRDEDYGSLFSPFLHDAVYMYALALNRTLRQGGTISDGLRVVENSKGVRFNGVSGLVATDDTANRDPTFLVKSLDRIYTLRDVIRVHTSRKDGETIQLLFPEASIWESRNGLRPTGAPHCGWSGEKCSSQDNTLLTQWVPIGTITAVVIIVGIVSGVTYYSRKRFMSSEVTQLTWKINYKDLVLLKDLQASYNTLNSAVSDDTAEAMLKGADTVAHYRGQLVWMKVHNSSMILSTEKDHAELKTLKDVSHENLNTFVGLCIDSAKPISLWHYCGKGSLEDVLLNSNTKLDWFFKYSLIKDLSCGLEFLHSSVIRSHGHLKTSNCLVDSRWVLKITDYGLTGLREGIMPSIKDKLWMSPEILRMTQVPPCGTQKGDVYSMGIIISEIISRDKAFGMYEDMTNEEIVARVRRGDNPPFRPFLRLDRDVEMDPHMLSLMKDCWIEEPERRPDVKEIRSAIKQMGRGKTANLMDHVLKMMETHAKNLESQVNERTRQLNEEMKKSDVLLYRMLPAVIADKLKKGVNVEPETYESVTVFFSNVAAFASIAQRATPYQLITFLNDICTLFDAILENYDVFKVETVNDGYLIVSGLPHRNGYKHASEIADLALNLQLSLVSFSVPNMPKEKFEIRCGIHTGQVVAGVVGLALPRYCLFGDTVNVANRIETNGKPSCIHISDETNKYLTQMIGGYITRPRGEIIIKGRGVMYTHWLLGKKEKQIQDKTDEPMPKDQSHKPLHYGDEGNTLGLTD